MAKKVKTKLNDDESQVFVKVSLRNGRPPSFESVDDLLGRAESYLDTCNALKEVPNKAGLSLFIGCSRETLSEYANNKGKEFSDAVKSIYSYLENAWVQRLSKQHPTGAIFYLKNAFGYMDAFDHTSGGKPMQYTVPDKIAQKQRIILDIKKEPEPITNAELTPKEMASV